MEKIFFGTLPDGKDVHLYVIKNEYCTLTVSDFGLTIVGFETFGRDIIGGFDSLNGYLAPPEEFEVGGYEVGGAAHWYNIPQTSPASSPCVVDWFRRACQ